MSPPAWLDGPLRGLPVIVDAAAEINEAFVLSSAIRLALEAN